MGLWRRAARGKSWRGEPTLSLRLRDPRDPSRYMSFHKVTVAPAIENGTPVVHLWHQTGNMAGTGPLTEGDARALARALIDAIEQSKSALLSDQEPNTAKDTSG